MRTARPLALAALTLLALAGCKKTPPTETKVTEATGPGSLPPDHPTVDLPPTSRGARRLSIDQLLASVQVVANPDVPSADGGIVTWKYANTSSMLRTMGKPDFIAVTDEDLSPSTLYMKFTGDIANDVCGQMIHSSHRSEVLMKDVGATDTLQSNPAAVKAHMRWLYLRYFGRYVADSDETTIQPLLQVFDAVVQGAKQQDGGLSDTNAVAEGWRQVCVAAFTSPEFHIY